VSLLNRRAAESRQIVAGDRVVQLNGEPITPQALIEDTMLPNMVVSRGDELDRVSSSPAPSPPPSSPPLSRGGERDLEATSSPPPSLLLLRWFQGVMDSIALLLPPMPILFLRLLGSPLQEVLLPLLHSCLLLRVMSLRSADIPNESVQPLTRTLGRRMDLCLS
jgi:hypothetical protein